MTKKNKRITAVSAAALGAVMLTGAAFANYNTSNGYEVGKNAAKGLLDNPNYTSELAMKLYIDSEQIAAHYQTQLYDRDGDVRLSETSSSECAPDWEYYMGHDSYKIWLQDGKYIRTALLDNGKERAFVYDNSYEWTTGRGALFDPKNNWDADDQKTIDKFIRFGELIGDVMVGDLKNNIVYVSGDDGFSTYEMNLDAVQIPEFVNAGISAMFSSMRSYDSDDPFMVVGDDPIVSGVSLKFTVNNEGRLTDGIMTGTLRGYDDTGTSHTAALEMSLKMYDYGTTVPERLDLSSLPEDTEYYDLGYTEEEIEEIYEEDE